MDSVYAIGAQERSGTYLVKIGLSESPHARLAALQTGSPLELSILGIRHGVGRESEHALHVQFQEYRLHGEWFRLNDSALRKLLAELRQPPSMSSPNRGSDIKGVCLGCGKPVYRWESFRRKRGPVPKGPRHIIHRKCMVS